MGVAEKAHSKVGGVWGCTEARRAMLHAVFGQQRARGQKTPAFVLKLLRFEHRGHHGELSHLHIGNVVRCPTYRSTYQ